MITEILNDWLRVIDTSLLFKVLNQINPENICPAKEDVFKAFTLCPMRNCKVVFLGQD